MKKTIKFKYELKPTFQIIKVGAKFLVPGDGEAVETTMYQELYDWTLRHEQEHEKIYDKMVELYVTRMTEFFTNYKTECFSSKPKAEDSFRKDFENARSAVNIIYSTAQNLDHGVHSGKIANGRFVPNAKYGEYSAAKGVQFLQEKNLTFEITKEPGDCDP